MANGIPNDYVYTGTGTGTELDPYIPSNCKEFMYAVLQDGAYVKMTSIIDFAQDPDYQAGITETLTIGATKVYTDVSGGSSTLYGINGLFITASNYFTFTNSSTQLLDHIVIKNCMWVMSSSPNFITASNNQNKTFQDCVMSFLINYNGMAHWFEQNYGSVSVYYINCSQYFQFVGNTGGVGKPHYFCYYRQYCTVELYMNRLEPSQSGSTYKGYEFARASYTTFFGEVNFPVSSGSGYQYCYCNTLTKCCMALSFINNAGGSLTIAPESASNTIFDQDLISSLGGYNLNNGFYYLTDTQMKNEQYLLSIGFLP